MTDALTSDDINVDSDKESIIDIKKNKQKKAIIKELYFNGTNTIAKLSHLIHASIPSITVLIEELIQENWVKETGIEITKQGRRPVIYGISAETKCILILDINTHDTKISVLNLKNEIIHSQIVDLPLKNDASFLEILADLITEIISEAFSHNKIIIGLGVSMPGLINHKTGTNYTYKALNGEDKSFGKLIEERFNLPVFVVNDSRATAFGEYNFGLGKEKSHILSINVDWGVGLGSVVNGQIFDGASGFAGELGHIQMNPEGVLCHCGKIGCLDSVASASSLLKLIKEGLKNGQISKLTAIKNNLEDIDLEMVIEIAQQGDAFAIDIIHGIGMELGRGLAIAVHLFNPQIIIIDGVLSKAQKLIVNPIEHAINKYCLAGFKEDLTIEISQLGDNAKILGTQAFVIKNLLKS